MKKIEAILLSAGKGTRTGLNIPKQFYKLNGKPIVAFSLELFEQNPNIKNIYVTYSQGQETLFTKCFNDYNITKAILVKGGTTRQESVFNALKEIKTKKVLIHEAARPLVSKDFLNEILETEGVAVIPTLPIPFTVSLGTKEMTGILHREELKNIQLPQMFSTDQLFEAHKWAKELKITVTEDGMLMFLKKHKVKFINGRESNIKITTELDLIIANYLLLGNYNF